MVEGAEAYWSQKAAARAKAAPVDEPEYEAIEMPRNSPTGVVCAFFATVVGFALIWHIWWLAILGLVGAYATFVVFAWRDITETEIPAEAVARLARAEAPGTGAAP
jgi:cytochrome o ubiquinol oxidase subunit 1